MTYVSLEPLTLFVIALGAVVVIRVIAAATSRSRSLLEGLALCLCVGGAIAVVTLLVCFASGTPMTVQERIASASLLMTMVGGVLFASAYRSEGDGPPPDDGPGDPPDDPGGDYAYPWWPEFERELRDYERRREHERSRERELTPA